MDVVIKSEAEFKKQQIEKWLLLGIYDECFCIESEETEPGFPDVIARKDMKFDFIEFKVSDQKGMIKFQRTQPLFYKKHPRLNITITALNNFSGYVIEFPAYAIFDKDGMFALSTKNEVKLY